MLKLLERFIDVMYFLIGGLVVIMLSYIVALEWEERQRHEDKKVCIEQTRLHDACNARVGEWKRAKHECA